MDEMEPPSVQELIPRANRQFHEADLARHRLDATTHLLLLECLAIVVGS